MNTAILLLSLLSPQAQPKPLQVLYVTGGGYHDYTAQGNQTPYISLTFHGKVRRLGDVVLGATGP